jgi:phospholipid-binding lipoprotein MlaA
MIPRVRTVAFSLALGAVLLQAGPLAAQDGDPLEPVNRAVFKFNRVVDGLVLEPASILYGNLVPDLGKRGIRNFLDNLRAPVVFVNDILQGERERAGITLGRFITNTILGFGLFDAARDFGFEKHDEDFGQTLAVWGVGEGPYIVLPILGPSNLRDAGGLVVDRFVFDPTGTLSPANVDVPWEARLARTGTDGIDTRYRLGDLISNVYETSLDPYATFRTVYRQRRAAEIRNQRADEATQENYDAIFQEDFDE